MTDADLLDPNPFAKSIYAPTGNLVARDIHASVGYSLTQWELCEMSFGTLFASFIAPDGNNTIAYRAFGGLNAPSTKREMIEHAAAAFFLFHKNANLHAAIKKLLNLYKDGAARRNEIAHATCMGTEFNKKTKQWTYYLVPGIHSTRKTAVLPLEPTKYRLSTKEIDHFASCYGQLGLRAGHLARDVRVFYGGLPKKPGRQRSELSED